MYSSQYLQEEKNERQNASTIRKLESISAKATGTPCFQIFNSSVALALLFLCKEIPDPSLMHGYVIKSTLGRICTTKENLLAGWVMIEPAVGSRSALLASRLEMAVLIFPPPWRTRGLANLCDCLLLVSPPTPRHPIALRVLQ